MKLTYGSYDFTNNMTSYNRNINILRSQTGLAAIADERWIVRSKIRGTSAADITSKCNVFTANMIDGFDLTFLDNSNASTSDFMTHAVQLNGCRVDRIRWIPSAGSPVQSGATFVNCREVEVVFSGQRMAGTTGDIMSWHESVTLIGNGGPKWIMVPSINGAVEPTTLIDFTPYSMVQMGRASGLDGYPAFPDALYPLFEHQEQRVQEQGTPRRWGRTNALNLEYPIMWKYVMESATALTGLPQLFH